MFTFFKLRQPGWLYTKQFYNDSKYEVAYKKFLTFFAQNIDTNIKVDANAINRMFELEKKLSFVGYFLN
jgi:hypothetical protein